jgi:hypothetical protein
VTVRARLSAAVAAAALVVSSAVVATAVGTAPATAQAAAPTFVLAAQSPWVAPGAGFTMSFDAANVPPGAEVAVTVHDALQSRTAFDSSIKGENLPPTRDRPTFRFDELPVDPATGHRVLTLPGLGGNGVFPLEVDLRSPADESLAHFVTHAVVAPVGADGALTVGKALNVAWVWPLQAEPAYVAGPVPLNEATLDDLQLRGRLGRQAVQLLSNTDVPLTLAPSPETLEAWAAIGKESPELKAGADSVRSAATSGRNQVLAGPFVPLDLPSIVHGNLQDVVTSGAGTRPGELTRGVATLEQFLGAHVDSGTALPGHLDSASLGILQSASVRQLVVDGDALVPVNEKYTPAHPYKLQTPGGDDSTAFTVLATDDGLEQFLTGDEPPALRAAHLLAGLALVAGEQPSIERGVTIANPAQWDADDTFVRAVLAGLRNNPLLAPTTVEGLLQRVPVATTDSADEAPVFRQLEPYSPPNPPVTAAQYAEGVHNRDAVEELVKSPNDGKVQNADRALATSLASAWANPAGRKKAAALLGSISDSVRSVLEQVEVQPQSTITITSSKAEIPISFRNNGADDITVELTLESDKLLFPEGNTREVTLPGKHNTTVRVAIETRGSGTTPVRMTVTTAGGLAIGPSEGTTIKVRSSFVSGVGVFLTVGAIVFLVVWWGWDIHRRRKKRAREQHPTYRLAPPSGQPA